MKRKDICNQQNAFKLSQIIREFNRLQQLAILANEDPIPTPRKVAISSFTSYVRKLHRGGLAVGDQSLQHIFDFAETTELKSESGDHDACSIDCVIESQRPEPFFAITLSTRRLLSELDSSRPVETDEIFKVIQEGYPLMLIGQSDMNRVWHLRYAGAKL